jgi:D-arginine dehydrogenase
MDVDFLILGGGIVGASVAAALGPGHRVLLLEAEAHPGTHATGRSAALYTQAYGPPQVRALTRASRGFFDQPPPAWGDTPLLQPRGTLFVATAAQADDARALHQRLRTEGLPAMCLDTAQALARVPVLRPEAAALAVFDPDAFDIDVHALLQGALRTLRAQGGQVVTGARITALRYDGRAWQAQDATGRTWAAPTVVNAAGAWADQVAALAGVRPIGLQPRRRSAFTFDAPDHSARHWPAVVAMDESWYFKPDAGGLLGSPANADPAPPHDVVPEELDIATGIHRIQQATTLSIRRPRHTWAGLRSFVADGEPVCGYAPDAPGFFWAAALGGYGIQSAPAFGALCAALLRGQAVPAVCVAQGVDATLLAASRAGLGGPR